MANCFEVGGLYYNGDGSLDPIEVLKRSAKTVWVRTSRVERMMRIKNHDNGGEYVVWGRNPESYRWIYTYDSSDRMTDMECEEHKRNEYSKHATWRAERNRHMGSEA